MTAVADVWDDFRSAVNMSPKALADSLATDQSTSVGQTAAPASRPGTGAAGGSCRSCRPDRLTSARTTTPNCARSSGTSLTSAQRPDTSGDELLHSTWDASLKNWGRDPT